MLGKNNFKERLRKMENQNKHDRFSIRKLSIGAASVLIGFAFMTGLGSHTALADPVSGDQAQSSVVETSEGNQGVDANAGEAAGHDQATGSNAGEAQHDAGASAGANNDRTQPVTNPATGAGNEETNNLEVSGGVAIPRGSRAEDLARLYGMMLPAMPPAPPVPGGASGSSSTGTGSVDYTGSNPSSDPVGGTAPDFTATYRDDQGTTHDVWTHVTSADVANNIYNNAQVIDENNIPRKISVQTDINGMRVSGRPQRVNNLPIWWSRLLDSDNNNTPHDFSYYYGSLSTTGGGWLPDSGDLGTGSSFASTSLSNFLGTPDIYTHVGVPLYSPETRTNSVINTEIARQWKLPKVETYYDSTDTNHEHPHHTVLGEVDPNVTMTEVFSAATDGSMTHTFYVNNKSNDPYHFMGIYWNLDTMLDDNDGVTIYGDGKGGGFLVNSALTVSLTPKYGTKLTAMRWKYGTSPLPLTSVTAGTANHYDDSAVHYQLNSADIAPGATKVWGFGEQVFTQGMDPTKLGVVRVRYVDKDDHDIATTNTRYVPLTSITHENYDATAISVPGYHLIKGPSSQSVPVDFGTSEVSFKYERDVTLTTDAKSQGRDVSYGQVLTDDDARRLISYTGERPISSVEWVDGGSLSDPVSSEGRDLTADENGSLDTSLTNGFKLSSVDAGNSIASAIAANNGVANTTAYIRVSFSPSSSDPSDTLPAYIIPVRLNVHGGVANDHKVVLEVPNDTTNLEAKASDITDEDAQDLIGNASSLTGATNFTAATGFKLVKDETGNAFEDSDLKYDNNNNNVDGGSYHNLTPVSGYVQISYGSSAIKQYVPVTIYVAAAASRYTPTISNDSNYNHITVHATSNGEVPVATQIADFVDPNNFKNIIKISGVDDSSTVIDNLSWDTSNMPSSFEVDSTGKSSTTAGIVVHYKDGSSYTLPRLINVNVIGGKEKPATPDTSRVGGYRYPVEIANGGTLGSDEAKNAVESAVDSTTLEGLFGHDYSSAGHTITYSWANLDGSGAPDTTFIANDPDHGSHVRQANVVITYVDGTKQDVLVHYYVKSDAEDWNGSVSETDAAVNPITAHANEDINNVSADGKLTVSDSHGNPMPEDDGADGSTLDGWKFDSWVIPDATDPTGYHAIDAAHPVSLDDTGLTNGVKTVTSAYAKIKLRDGSYVYSASALPIKVIGAVGQDVTFDKQGTSFNPNALTTGDVNGNTAIKNATGADGIGQFDNDTHTRITYTWTNNVTNNPVDWTQGTKDAAGNWAAVPVTLRVNYGDGTHQDITLNLKIRSDGESFDAHNGSVRLADHNNPVTAHANQVAQPDATGKLRITQGRTELSGWHFVGWALKDGNTYHDVDGTSYQLDLSDNGLNRNGQKNVNTAYAKIQLEDGSTIYSANPITIRVTGGVGQAKTYPSRAATAAAPDAKEGIKNTAQMDALGDSSISYRWVKYAGTGTPAHDTVSAWTDFTNPAALDAQGKSIANNDVYVEIAYGDGTYQYVKAPLTIQRASDTYGDSIVAKGEGITTHVNAPSTGYVPGDGFTNNIPAGANVTVSYAWATAPDVTVTGLDDNGMKDETLPVTITFTDNNTGLTSTLTKDVTVHVIGGVGQAKTYTATTTMPDAKEGIKNTTQMGTAPVSSYRWVEYTGTGTPAHDNVTAFTDFANPAALDAQGKSIANNNIYVEIAYNDGTYQYVKTPLTIQRASDIYGDSIVAKGEGITTHVNAPSADYAPSDDSFTNNIPASANVTVSYAWATAPDVTVTGLDGEGKKDETRPVTVTFTDHNTGLTSTLTKDMAVHVIGGVAASEHQSVQQSTLPTADQAKAAIGNNAALAPYGAEYAWYASEGGAPLTTSDTVLPSGTNTGSKNVWIKISYNKAGVADGEQWVQTTLNLTNDLAHQFHDLLSSNTVTVVKSTTPISGNLINGSINNAVVQDPTTRLYHLTTARVINVPANLPSNTSFKWVTPVDISSVGNVAGNVQVTYNDGSKDTVPAVINVIDHVPTMNEIFTPAGGEIWVAPNTTLDATHGADRAKAGITNSADMPAGTTYSWNSTPEIDTSHPGTRLVGIVNVKYSDNTSNSASVVIHVNGRSTEEDHPTVPSEASRYTPQGKDLYKTVNTTNPNDIGAADLAIANTASSSAADKLPSDATYSWQYVENNILATAGTKGAIVRVTYGDHSHTDVPVSVHVTASQTDAELHPANGQDITTTVGDPTHKVTAQNGIANASTMPAGTTYSWAGTAPDTSAVGDIPANVKVAYRDGSANTVAIMVHVTNPGGAGRTLASDNLNPTGGTITEYKSATAALTIPEVLAKLNSQHSFFTNENPATVAGANPISYSWASEAFGRDVLKTTGLKSGQVLIKYGDNSTDTVTVMVNVKDLASKYDDLTAKSITTTVGGSVTAKEGINGTIPDSEVQRIDFISSANLTAAGTSADPKAPSYTAQAAGTYSENVKITFADDSTKVLATSLVVSSPNQRLADVMIPTGGLITRYVGDSLDDNDAKEAVSDNGDMPDNTHYSWVVTPDTSSKGLKSGEVQVSYPDNSEGTLVVHVNVKPLADKYTPVGQSITVAEPSSNPLSGSDRAKDGISNTAQLPADVTYAWATPVDISQADVTVPGIVKITYRDNSVDTVAVNVVVGHPENNPQTNNPVAKIINVNYGDVFTNDGANAKRGVQNTDSMPSDATYSFVGSLPTDSSNKIDQNGDIPVLVHIVGTNYDKSVATVIHVIDASQELDANNQSPIGQDIYAKAGDPLPEPKKGIIGADDPDSVLSEEGARYSWATGGEPDVSSVGTKSGIVQVTYRDGSSKLVPVTVTVTADGNPTPVPGSGSVTAADYHPYGKSIERQRSDDNVLDDTDARIAVGFPTSESVPAGTSYSWVDPNFARTALRSGGYKTSQVKVTYADGSESIVLATVHVKTMADTYTPAPLPITFDPETGLPNNLNDPDNPTPAIDANSLPSGTLTRFVDGVTPDNLTPGDHPTQIEVDYPDGTRVIVPTVIHVPARNSEPANNDSLMPRSFAPSNIGFDNSGLPGLNNNSAAPADNGNVSAPVVPNEPGTPSVPADNTNNGNSGNNGNNSGTATTPNTPDNNTPASTENNGAENTVNGNANNGTANNNTTPVDNGSSNNGSEETEPEAASYQKLVLYIGKGGRIVKRGHITVSKDEENDLAELTRLATTKRKLPRGYKATGKAKKVAKHLDVWVNKSVQPSFNRAPRTKDVLYVAADGTIVKRTRITGSVRKLAKSKLPKGYKITGIDRVNNHYNVWIKKTNK